MKIIGSLNDISLTKDLIREDACGFVPVDDNNRVYFISLNIEKCLECHSGFYKLLVDFCIHKFNVPVNMTNSVIFSDKCNFGIAINITDSRTEYRFTLNLGGIINNNEFNESYDCIPTEDEISIIMNYVIKIEESVGCGNGIKS